MANLGRLRFVMKSVAGLALPNVSVEVRRQGAQAFGNQSGSPLTVDAVNGVLVGDDLAVNAASSPTRTVSAITATTITCGVGFSVSDDDRLTIVTAGGLPTLYEDAVGNTSRANPMTTDANGVAECYALGGMYDVLFSGGGVTTTLQTDVATESAESTRSNVYTTGSAVAYKQDTLRSLAAGDSHTVLSVAGSNVFVVKGDGEVQAGVAGATHSLTGTLTVSSTITGTTTVVGTTGVTATTGDVQATAGNLLGKRTHLQKGTTLVAGTHFTFSAGWGDTAALVLNDAGNEYDSRGMFAITANGSGIAANPTVTLTYADGTYTTKPRMVTCRTNSVAPTTGFWIVNAAETTATWVFVGTPVAGTQYGCVWNMIG